METKLIKLSNYLSQVEAFGFSGAILVGLEDNIIFQKAYGFSDYENNKKSELNSIYDIGSITKPFTAVGILRLIEEKRLGLHDRLVNYLTDQEWTEEKKKITIHHLLTHTSGITDTLEDDYHEETKSEVLQRISKKPLISEPGESFNYSNDGYTLLAILIEKVTSKDYESFMNNAIFEIANLTETGYVLPEWDISNVANGYDNFSNHGHSLQKCFPTWSLKGNGGMLSTLNDMFKMHLALEDNLILNQETTKIMYTPYKNNYGCGWQIQEKNGETIISHGGASYYGTSAGFYRNITSKLTFILFANQSFNHFPLSRFLMHHIKSIFENDVSEEFLKALTFPHQLEELPQKLQSHKIDYEFKNKSIEINWGKYIGLMNIGHSEIFLTEEEQQYVQKSKIIVQEILDLNFEGFKNVFSNKENMDQRLITINRVIKDYIYIHGEINHVFIYGVSPSVLVEDTTEVRIELKNSEKMESLNMYLFWKDLEHLHMSGFVELKEQASLLVKVMNKNSNNQFECMSIRLNDHQFRGFNIDGKDISL